MSPAFKDPAVLWKERNHLLCENTWKRLSTEQFHPLETAKTKILR